MKVPAKHRQANTHYPVWWGSDGYRPVCGLTFAALLTGAENFCPAAPGLTTSGMACSELLKGVVVLIVFIESGRP